MVFVIGLLSIVSTVLCLMGILTAVLGIGAAGSDKPGVGVLMVIGAIIMVAASF